MTQQTAVVKIINSRIYYLGVYGNLFIDITEQWIKFQFK
jgi:hypothetical protein